VASSCEVRGDNSASSKSVLAVDERMRSDKCAREAQPANSTHLFRTVETFRNLEPRRPVVRFGPHGIDERLERGEAQVAALGRGARRIVGPRGEGLGGRGREGEEQERFSVRDEVGRKW
jgi:hypothetical protein